LPFIFPKSERGLRPIPLLVDNLAAISTANHPKVTSASKHLQLRVFRLRDYQGDNNCIPRVTCFWVPTKNNVADFMSKLLKSTDFPRLGHFLVDNSYKASGETEKSSSEGSYCYATMAYPTYGTEPTQLYLNEYSKVCEFNTTATITSTDYHPSNIVKYTQIYVEEHLWKFHADHSTLHIQMIVSNQGGVERVDDLYSNEWYLLK